MTQNQKLLAAIRKHRDQRGDDRCWLDDKELYSVLPEGTGDADLRLIEPPAMLENCKRFIACRHPEGEAYISPQRQVETLEERIKDLEGLVSHCWVHSGYQDCGRKQMTNKQKRLYDSVIKRDAE